MNKYNAMAITALLVFVVAIPWYALREQGRMLQAQAEVQEQIISEAAAIYLENCATCHGLNGEGLGSTPALNKAALAEIPSVDLFRTIARAAHGSPMTAWHVSEGGLLNDFQVTELVTLIQQGDWEVVQLVAEIQNVPQLNLPPVNVAETYLLTETAEDPHRCTACHEEPEIHAGLFGLNCARCHSAQAWTPAVLVRHTFALDHGSPNAEALPCQSCHETNYVDYTCYSCHEHQAEEMTAVHADEPDVYTLTDCIACHPTGMPGEAALLTDSSNQIQGSK